MNDENNNLEELAAVLNGFEMTDDEGQVKEEQTHQSEPAADEEITPEEASAPVEKPLPSIDEPTQGESDDEETLAEDESGKKYVPQKRFNKVYGRLKELEREREELLKAQTPTSTKPSKAMTSQTSDVTTALELEMLKTKYPQFDRDSDLFSPQLDQLGGQIYKANPGITRLEAAKRAIEMAREISRSEVSIKQQAKLVKAAQADSGITSRVTNRQSTQVDLTKLSHDDLEAYMKVNGLWDQM